MNRVDVKGGLGKYGKRKLRRGNRGSCPFIDNGSDSIFYINGIDEGVNKKKKREE
jgi:hypothetical protein